MHFNQKLKMANLTQSEEVLQKQDLLVTPQGEGQFVIVALNLVVQQRSLTRRYGLPTCLFNEKTECGGLIKHSDFALKLVRGAVDKDAMALDENLVDIDHQSASVSQCVTFFNPLGHCLPILLVLRGRTQISRAEDVRLLLYGEVVVSNDPVVVHRSHFLNLALTGIVVDGSSPGPEDSDHGIDLVSKLRAHEVIWVCFPDREDAANGEVGVDDGAAVKWVVSHHVAVALPASLVVGFFLTGEALHERVSSEVLGDDVVALHVLVELLVAEEVGSLQLDDGRVAQEGSNLHTGVEDGLDHTALHLRNHCPFVDTAGLCVLHQDQYQLIWRDQRVVQKPKLYYQLIINQLFTGSLQYWLQYIQNCANQNSLARPSTSYELPTAKESLSSKEVILKSMRDLGPVVTVFPPAFQIKNPTAAASYKARSLQTWDFDPILLRTPLPLMKIWPTSGTRPPVYLRVYPFLIHAFTTFSQSSFSLTARRLPGLNILDFSRMTRWSCDTIHSFSMRVSSCTTFLPLLQTSAVVLGPQMMITAFSCAPRVLPIRLAGSVFQMEKMLPMAKLVSMIELPSSGSQVTTQPSPSAILWQRGRYSLAKPLTEGLLRRCFSTISSHLTSWCSCLSPNLLCVSRAITGECLRKREIQTAASSRVNTTETSSPWRSGLRYYMLGIKGLQDWNISLIQSQCQRPHRLPGPSPRSTKESSEAKTSFSSRRRTSSTSS